MSTDREAQAWLGWMIDLDDLWALCEEREAVTHEEPRFDPKTGEAIKPEVVIDEEPGHYWHGKYIRNSGICEIIDKWIKEQGIGLHMAPMQWSDGAYSHAAIGVDADGEQPSGLVMSITMVEFVAKHFNIKGQPRIMAFMLVD